MKIRRLINEVFTKLITIPAPDMVKFEKEEMMKKRPHIRNTL